MGQFLSRVEEVSQTSIGIGVGLLGVLAEGVSPFEGKGGDACSYEHHPECVEFEGAQWLWVITVLSSYAMCPHHQWILPPIGDRMCLGEDLG